MVRDIGGACPGDRNVAEWDGSGEMCFDFDARVVSTSRSADGHNRPLRIEATDPADPVCNIHVWMPDYGRQSFAGLSWQSGAAFSPSTPCSLSVSLP